MGDQANRLRRGARKQCTFRRGQPPCEGAHRAEGVAIGSVPGRLVPEVDVVSGGFDDRAEDGALGETIEPGTAVQEQKTQWKMFDL